MTQWIENGLKMAKSNRLDGYVINNGIVTIGWYFDHDATEWKVERKFFKNLTELQEYIEGR